MTDPEHFRQAAIEAARPIVAPCCPVRETGGFGVMHGVMNPQDLARAAQGMSGISFEPQNYPSPPVPNAYAYIPLSGLNKDNPRHAPFWKEIEDLPHGGGFLLDGQGSRIGDPHGPGTFLVDFRKPEVRAIMRRYIQQLSADGYRNFFFDAIDSVSLTEKNTQATGLAAATVDFVAEEHARIAARGGRSVVNGGLWDGAGDLTERLGRSGVSLALENQFMFNGERQSAGTNAWTSDRLAPYLRAAINSGFSPTVYFIEHAPASRLAAERSAASNWARNLLGSMNIDSNRPGEVTFGIYMTDQQHYRQLTPQPAPSAQPEPTRSR